MIALWEQLEASAKKCSPSPGNSDEKMWFLTGKSNEKVLKIEK